MENKYNGIIGSKYNRLTCIEYSHQEKGVGYFYKFMCDCGNEKIYNLSRVKNGYIKSCGCLRKENSRKAIFQDLTGQKFNYLTVVEYIGQNNGRTMWKCLCDCGNITEVDSSSLKSGNTKACGCHQCDGWCNSKTHGMSKSRIYRIWSAMKSRCYQESNKYYCNYGGRGITVCQEWLDDFINFYNWSMANGYTDELTIDRIDNDKGYSPDNCRWATREAQMNNTRSNRIVEYNGRKQTLTQWSRELGIEYRFLESRINRYGWSVEKAFETPPKRRSK